LKETMENISSEKFQDIVGAVIALGVVIAGLFVLGRAYWVWHLQRRPGTASPGKKPTLFDVRELLLKGEKDLAIRTYKQVFNVDQKEARAAVDNLEKSLHNQG